VSDELVLQDKKNYNHQESIKLLGEVRNLFQEKLKLVVIEWISEEKEQNIEKQIESCSKIFIVKKEKKPLYEQCNGIDDVEKVLNNFNNSLERLLNNFDAIVDNNININADSKNSLESYADAINKGITVFQNQRKRRSSKFKELSTVKELREELRCFLAEIISRYIIQVLIVALYERIKNNAGEIYKLAVNQINKFFVENGVYTKEINLGEKIDPEFVEPTIDSVDNVTDDFNKLDTIDEIRRYPYLFTDETMILDGSAKIWRRKI